MKTIRLTTADAIVRYLIAQKSEMPDGGIAPLFPGVFAIFGHGNVTCLGHAQMQRVVHVFLIHERDHQAICFNHDLGVTRFHRKNDVMIATGFGNPDKFQG